MKLIQFLGSIQAPRDWDDRANPGAPGHFGDLFGTLCERLGIDAATTQFTDFAGRPQYLVGDHRPLPELIG